MKLDTPSHAKSRRQQRSGAAKHGAAAEMSRAEPAMLTGRADDFGMPRRPVRRVFAGISRGRPAQHHEALIGGNGELGTIRHHGDHYRPLKLHRPPAWHGYSGHAMKSANGTERSAGKRARMLLIDADDERKMLARRR